jgi:hypothetical protein
MEMNEPNTINRKHSSSHVGYALQMLTDFSVTTPSETIQGKAGDYILKDNKGFVSVLKDHSFRRNYRILHKK